MHLGTRPLEQRLGLTALDELFAEKFAAAWRDVVALGVEQLQNHGSFSAWLTGIDALTPSVARQDLTLHAPHCQLAQPEDYTQALMTLGPWKKGPFQIGEVLVDAEWRSDLKWERLMAHLGSLAGETVLDVGTGNGYFLLRALGSGAKQVLGLEPHAQSVAQFLALSRFFHSPGAGMLPVGAEQFVENCAVFDLVLSMGVLYHRRAPLEHLAQVIGCVRPGGRILIETLMVDGQEGEGLVPAGRYANMRNVWFLPSIKTLESWLTQLGVVNVKHDFPVTTTPEEQRSTSWCGPISLRDALDPVHPDRTIEGYPSPRRVMMSGQVRS